jgi:hypothetical protein
MSVFRRRFTIAALFGVVVGGAFLACGYDWDFVDGGIGSDGSIASDSGDASLEDAASDALVTGDVTTGGACSSSRDCDRIDYCVFPDHLCGGSTGGAAVAGTCQPLPTCTSGIEPIAGDVICGCDDVSYTTECAAASARQDLNAKTGACAAAGVFQCRYAYCQRTTNFCEEFADSGAACVPFSCTGARDCMCATSTSGCDGGCSGGGTVVGVDAAMPIFETCN